MATANDDFIHQLAIKLSRALNIVNPNDLLAQRVTDIAKTNSLDDFTNGICSASRHLVIDTDKYPQRLERLESLRIRFSQNYTRKYYCMQNRSPLVFLRIQSKVLLSMTATFWNLSRLGQAV